MPEASPPARARPSPSIPPRSDPLYFPLPTSPPRAGWQGPPTTSSPAPTIFLGPAPGAGHWAPGTPPPRLSVPPSSLPRGAPQPSGCPRPAHLPGLHAWVWPPAKGWLAARAPGVSRAPPLPAPPCRLGVGGVAQRPGGDAPSASRRKALGGGSGSRRGAGQFPLTRPGAHGEESGPRRAAAPLVQPGQPACTPPSLRPPGGGATAPVSRELRRTQRAGKMSPRGPGGPPIPLPWAAALLLALRVGRALALPEVQQRVRGPPEAEALGRRVSRSPTSALPGRPAAPILPLRPSQPQPSGLPLQMTHSAQVPQPCRGPKTFPL